MELGKNNKLIWYLPEDLKFFRKMTMGKTIIMGRKTFESLPGILPNRKHIVLSSHDNYSSQVEVYRSIKDLLVKYKDYSDELFVIGGGSIYRSFMEYATKMYLTEINASNEMADTYFPRFSKSEWNSQILDMNIYDGIGYKHVLYVKKQKNKD